MLIKGIVVKDIIKNTKTWIKENKKLILTHIIAIVIGATFF